MLDWLPTAIRKPMHEDGFDWQVDCPVKGVLHTTEGVGGVPAYPSQYEPHLTVVPVANLGVSVYQHIALTKAAYALKHPAGTVATNGAHALQMELVGTCDPNGPKGAYYWPQADDKVLLDLYRKVIKPISDAYDIPLTAPTFRPYPASYGANGVRLSEAAWLAYHGWLGHEHVPGNDHGDPGAFPWDRFVNLAGQQPAPHPQPKPGVIHGPVQYGDSDANTDGSVSVIQHRLDKQLGVHLDVDGQFGRQTLIQVQAWQRKHGLAQDGVVGPATAKSLGFSYTAR